MWNLTAASLGTPSVPPNSDSSNNGISQTFTLTYPDPPSFAGVAFGWEQFLVKTATNALFCFVHYDRAGNALWMYSSDVGFFLGPVNPGIASSALTSSSSSVDTAGANGRKHCWQPRPDGSDNVQSNHCQSQTTCTSGHSTC